MEPKIRLKGFCGEWESTPFLETFDYIKNNSLSRDMLSQEGEVQNIHYGDVLIKYGECVDSNKDDIPFVKDNETAKVLLRTGALQNGDVVIADAAEDNSVGKCSEIVCDSTAQIVSGLHTIPVRPKSEFASRYMGYYMNSPAYHNQLLPRIQGTKISSISKKAVACTNIIYPASKDEQRALATFFTSLDNQISAAEKRLASLKQVKAASLQAMFPQEGETTPKLRFKGCEGEWKKVKLGEIVRLKAGNSLSLAQLKEWGSYPCYGGNGIRTYLPFFSHDGEYNLIGRVGALCGNINYVNGKFYATEHALVVYPFDDINVRFLFYVLVFADLNKYKKGCAQPVLSASTLYNVDIIIPPSLTEQRQIASYFTSLDRQITSQSSKISKLKQIKSACLDQMFV